MMTRIHIYQASRERNSVITDPGSSEIGPTFSYRSNSDLPEASDGTKHRLNHYCSQGTFMFCLHDLISEK